MLKIVLSIEAPKKSEVIDERNGKESGTAGLETGGIGEKSVDGCGGGKIYFALPSDLGKRLTI